MRGPRETVEWSFAKMLQLFSLLDSVRKLRLWSSAVCDWWLCGVVFANLHTCLYGSQVSSYFEAQPCTVDDYLRNANANRIP